MEFVGNYAPRGLSPQTDGMPVIQKNQETYPFPGFAFSRSDKIRTCDLCVPNAALYQTEPRFVNCKRYYIHFS